MSFISIIVRQLSSIFWASKKRLIDKNFYYKNIHKGETCFILGNGASLKYYNFEKLSKLISIGTNYTAMDSRAKHLNLKYCIIPAPYQFYKIRLNTYNYRLEKNLIEPIFKKMISENGGTNFFMHLSNYYSLRQWKNSNYFFEFGVRDNFCHDLDGKFFAKFGGLLAMIGLAKYMGFSKAILLGCDYLGAPKLEGHFYDDGPLKYGSEDRRFCEQIFEISDGIELTCVFPKGITSRDFPSISYEEFFNTKEHYHANSEIINKDYYNLMRKAANYNKKFPQIKF